MGSKDEGESPVELILASTSPYRRVQLARLGVSFRCQAPPVDEEILKRDLGSSPQHFALALAEAKAKSLTDTGVVIIAGDQLVAFEGRILGKPGTHEAAVAQLMSLSGKTHHLITALAVLHDGVCSSHVDEAALTMRALGRAEIERYIEADRPLDCAGSYKLEQRGIALFERIVSEDHSAITGLPLMALTTILRRLGIAIP
jgi:septum formation protein